MTEDPTEVEIENSGADIYNKGVNVENTGVGIETLGVQKIVHKGENDEDEDNNIGEGEYKGIVEGYVHHPHITSPTEWCIFNLIPKRIRNYSKHLGVDDYAHAQIVH